MAKELTDKKRTLIFINIMISGIATSILSTAMTTALPPVVTDFGISVSTGQWMTSGYSLAMGIMMPLLTWGTSFVDKTKVADASSLLTSLRTISGSIGSAVFVSIMTVVGSKSKAVYGDAAQMHGLNVAFLSMSAGTLLMLIIAVFFVDGKAANKQRRQRKLGN